MDNEVSDRDGIHVPDLVHMLPDGDRKKIILYCLNELQLSSNEAYKALNGATRVLNAMDVLLCCGRDI